MERHQSVTGLKTMKAEEIKGYLPFELTSDGVVIAVVQSPDTKPVKAKTQCPNCKLVYDYTEPDGKPFIFTLRHP